MPITHENPATEEKEYVLELMRNGLPFVITEIMIAEIEASPSFKRKHQEAEEFVAKLDLSKIFEKPSE